MEPQSPISAADIRVDHAQSSRSSVLWTSASRIAIQAIQLVTFVALARLLPPGDFGLVAIVAVFTAFGLLLTDLGLGSAIIQARHLSRPLASATFWINLVSGFLLTLVVVALRRPISLLFGEPRLAHLLVIGSLTFALSVSVTHIGVLERERYFRLIAAIELTSAAVSSVCAVLAATHGYGAASIVLGPLLYVALVSVLAIAAVRFVPGRTNRSSLRALWNASAGVAGFNAFNYWARNADNLLLGLTTSVTDLAYYSRAYQLMFAPVQQTNAVIGRVLFPTLANYRDDPKRQSDAYLRAVALSAITLFPLCLTLVAVAPAFVSVLLGKRWAGMVPILSILALSSPPQILAGTTGALYQAHGKGMVLFRRGGLLSILTVLAIVAGLPWGGIGVATAYCIRQYALLPYTLRYPLRLARLSAHDLSLAIGGVTVAGVASAGAAAIAGLVGRHLGSWLELGIQVLVAGTVYVVLVRRIAPGPWSDLVRVVLRRGSEGGTPAPHRR